MNRRRTDAAVALLLGAVLVAGGGFAWQAFRIRGDSGGSMMGATMDSMHGPDPLWFLFGALLVATVIAGVYLLVRREVTTTEGRRDGTTADGSTATADAEITDGTSEQAGSPNPEATPRKRVLDLLPEDERRILEPVLASPGITQVELRDRSGFSKSKVSQTVSGLEERGLLYRERQGRTYRLYPSDDLAEDRES